MRTFLQQSFPEVSSIAPQAAPMRFQYKVCSPKYLLSSTAIVLALTVPALISSAKAQELPPAPVPTTAPTPATPPAPATEKPAQETAYLKAIQNADAGLKDAKQLVTATQATKTALAKLDKKSGDEAALTRLDEATTLIKAIPRASAPNDKLTRISQIGAHLGSLQTQLEAAQKDAAALPTPSATLKAALARFAGLKKNLTDQIEAAKKASDELNGSVTAAVAAAAQTPDEIAKTLKPLTDKSAGAHAVVLRSTLAKNLVLLPQALQNSRSFDEKWKTFDGELKKITVTAPQPSQDTLKKALGTVLINLQGKSGQPGWLHQFEDYLSTQNIDALTFVKTLVNNTEPLGIDAATRERDVKNLLTDLKAITEATDKLVEQLQKNDFPGVDEQGQKVTPLTNGIIDLRSELQKHTDKATVISGILAQRRYLDVSQWDFAPVRLYFFDDVPRMMKMLNDGAEQKNTSTLQATADESQKNLLTATQAAVEARAAVTSARDALDKSRRENSKAIAETTSRLEKARADAVEPAQADIDATKAQAVAQTERDIAQRELDAAIAAKAGEAEARAKLNEADRALTLAKEDARIAKAKNDAAQAEKTAAASALAAISAEKGLADQLKTAEANAQTKQEALNTAIGSALVLAQTENRDFARARDNAPFYAALPDLTKVISNEAASSDPLKRVMLYGFPDSKVIWVRGQRDDVDTVREMIMTIDRPEAQALLTLWTLEIGSKADERGVRSATRAMQTIEDELDTTRLRITRTMDALSEAINQEVNHTVTFGDWSFAREFQQASDIVKNIEKTPAAERTEEQKNKLEANTNAIRDLLAAIKSLEDSDLKETVAFYDPKVLKNLGWKDVFARPDDRTKLPSRAGFLKAVIPDPRGTTTLAEALVILSLTTPERRSQVFDRFVNTVARQIAEDLNDPALKLVLQVEPKTPEQMHARRRFVTEKLPNLSAFLGMDGNGTAPVESFQREMVDELQRNAIPQVLEYVRDKAIQDDAYLNQFRAAKLRLQDQSARYGRAIQVLDQTYTDLLVNQPGNLTGTEQRNLLPLLGTGDAAVQKTALSRALAAAKMEADRQIGHINREFPDQIRSVEQEWAPATFWLFERTTLGNHGLADLHEALRTGRLAEVVAQATGFRRSTQYRISNARRSALNGTLKRYLRAIDDDLQKVYVRPMIVDLRRALEKGGVAVGTLQRTQVIASNRLVARVDPKGSAQLAVGEEQNILRDATQLAQLVTAAQAGPLTIGSALASFNTLSAADNKDQVSPDAKPGIYGINTGNLFQVTPITDPTGQTLRFRFDYVSATQIQEPSGITDPQLPRIERHGINTEVQLGNQEIRTISSFEANSRLGRAKKRSGGIPILRDLPVVRDIPLVGWFVKRSGKAAMIQQSVILGQTAMFPTVQDIIDLLAQRTSVSDTADDQARVELLESLKGSPVADWAESN